MDIINYINSNYHNLALRYIEYLNGHAYIPIQDLPKYKKAYNEYLKFNNLKR